MPIEEGVVSTGPANHVLVCALTYRRPDDLAALLPELVAQAEASTDRVDVLIIDNDPGAGARQQVATAARSVRYLHVPEPGIANARNGALEAAVAEDFDVLVFIDDDERPSATWLEDLLSVWRASRPAAVVGPVVSSFEAEPSEWISAGGFFDRRRLVTGAETDVAATNNLLLDVAFLRRTRLRFDVRFGLTGGSDTLFTRALRRQGGRIVWCDEAVVTDVVPAARATRRWVLDRAHRSGNSDAMTSLALAGPGLQARTRIRFLVRGSVRLLGGAVAVAAGALTRSTRLQARGARTRARGRGMLAGIAGRAFVEYRRG